MGRETERERFKFERYTCRDSKNKRQLRGEERQRGRDLSLRDIHVETVRTRDS